MARWKPSPLSRTRKRLRELRQIKGNVPEGKRFPNKRERDMIDLQRRNKRFEDEGVITPNRKSMRTTAKASRTTGSGYTKKTPKKKKSERKRRG